MHIRCAASFAHCMNVRIKWLRTGLRLLSGAAEVQTQRVPVLKNKDIQRFLCYFGE